MVDVCELYQLEQYKESTKSITYVAREIFIDITTHVCVRFSARPVDHDTYQPVGARHLRIYVLPSMTGYCVLPHTVTVAPPALAQTPNQKLRADSHLHTLVSL